MPYQDALPCAFEAVRDSNLFVPLPKREPLELSAAVRDTTPGAVVTVLITARGVCLASREGLLSLFTARRARGAA